MVMPMQVGVDEAVGCRPDLRRSVGHAWRQQHNQYPLRPLVPGRSVQSARQQSASVLSPTVRARSARVRLAAATNPSRTTPEEPDLPSISPTSGWSSVDGGDCAAEQPTHSPPAPAEIDTHSPASLSATPGATTDLPMVSIPYNINDPNGSQSVPRLSIFDLLYDDVTLARHSGVFPDLSDVMDRADADPADSRPGHNGPAASRTLPMPDSASPSFVSRVLAGRSGRGWADSTHDPRNLQDQFRTSSASRPASARPGIGHGATALEAQPSGGSVAILERERERDPLTQPDSSIRSRSSSSSEVEPSAGLMRHQLQVSAFSRRRGWDWPEDDGTPVSGPGGGGGWGGNLSPSVSGGGGSAGRDVGGDAASSVSGEEASGRGISSGSGGRAGGWSTPDVETGGGGDGGDGGRPVPSLTGASAEAHSDSGAADTRDGGKAGRSAPAGQESVVGFPDREGFVRGHDMGGSSDPQSSWEQQQHSYGDARSHPSQSGEDDIGYEAALGFAGAVGASQGSSLSASDSYSFANEAMSTPGSYTGFVDYDASNDPGSSTESKPGTSIDEFDELLRRINEGDVHELAEIFKNVKPYRPPGKPKGGKHRSDSPDFSWEDKARAEKAGRKAAVGDETLRELSMFKESGKRAAATEDSGGEEGGAGKEESSGDGGGGRGGGKGAMLRTADRLRREMAKASASIPRTGASVTVLLPPAFAGPQTPSPSTATATATTTSTPAPPQPPPRAPAATGPLAAAAAVSAAFRKVTGGPAAAGASTAAAPAAVPADAATVTVPWGTTPLTFNFSQVFKLLSEGLTAEEAELPPELMRLVTGGPEPAASQRPAAGARAVEDEEDEEGGGGRSEDEEGAGLGAVSGSASDVEKEEQAEELRLLEEEEGEEAREAQWRQGGKKGKGAKKGKDAKKGKRSKDSRAGGGGRWVQGILVLGEPDVYGAVVRGCKAFTLSGGLEVLLVQDARALGPVVAWLRESIAEDMVLGIDTEWPPSFHKGGEEKLALIQVATATRVVLFHVACMEASASAPGSPLFDLLADPALTWVGAGWKGNDSVKISSAFSDALPPMRLVDVQTAARAAGWPRVGLQRLSAELLGAAEFSKSKSVSMANWAAPKLSGKQIRYAALDALLPPLLLRQLRLFAAMPGLRCAFCKQSMHAPSLVQTRPGARLPPRAAAAEAEGAAVGEPQEPVIRCDHCGREFWEVTVRPPAPLPQAQAPAAAANTTKPGAAGGPTVGAAPSLTGAATATAAAAAAPTASAEVLERVRSLLMGKALAGRRPRSRRLLFVRSDDGDLAAAWGSAAGAATAPAGPAAPKPQAAPRRLVRAFKPAPGSSFTPATGPAGDALAGVGSDAAPQMAQKARKKKKKAKQPVLTPQPGAERS